MISRIKKELELRFDRLVKTSSTIIFNFELKAFFNYLKTEPLINSILIDIEKKTEITSDSDILADSETDYPTFLEWMESKSDQYVLVLYYWLKRKVSTNSSNDILQDVFWINTEDVEKKAYCLIQPLVSYIVDNLRSQHTIQYYIERYSSRLALLGNQYFQNFRETDYQRNFALYLFDNGFNYTKESEFGNGKTDFLLNIEDTDYVLEIKYANDSKSDPQKWLDQLREYMKRFSIKKGCLLIFSTNNIIYKLELFDDNVSVFNIDVQNEKPSKQSKKEVKYIK